MTGDGQLRFSPDCEGDPHVDDLAVYRERIVAAGGKIHVEEQEVPGMDTLSLFTDPEGRMMGLWKQLS